MREVNQTQRSMSCLRQSYSTHSVCGQQLGSRAQEKSLTRAHHRDEIPERDVTYHLTCLLIYHGTTTHL